jgi:two-component system sensor histidine kinase ChiS
LRSKLGIVIIAFVALFGLRLYLSYGMVGNLPHAREGVLDLSRWKPDGVVPLRGEWIFYPNEYKVPKPGQALPDSDRMRYLQVPGSWDSAIGGDKPTPYGYGTYKLEIKLPQQEGNKYALRMMTIRTAHKLYVDGQLVGQAGVPGTSKLTTTPNIMPYTAEFSATKDTVELVIVVANYDYGRLGGIFDEIRFGTSKEIERNTQLSMLGNNFLRGFYIVSALYFLFIFLYRKQNKELLFFSAFFWMSFFFWATHGDRLLYWLFPDINFNWRTKLAIIPSLGIFYFLLLFVRSMFPAFGNRSITRFFHLLMAVSLVFLLLTDVTFFSHLELPIISIDFLMYLYAAYILVMASIKKVNGSTHTLVAAICITSEALFQGIYYLGYAPSSSFPPFERIIFIITMFLLIAKRFFSNMEQVEVMSRQLLVANRLKNDFLANTSQEIRLPLQGIINLAQIMIDEGDMNEGRQKERLTLMVATGRRMAHLMNDIMDLSKLTEGGLELTRRPVDIRMTVNGVLEVMHYMTGSETVKFENRTEYGIPFVHADEQRVMQILFNLLHYVIKNDADGIIIVKGEYRPRNDDVAVSIQASVGQAPQAGNFSETEFTLDISRQLVELHGGTLTVQRSSSLELVIHFTLPLASEHEVDSSTSSETERSSGEVAAAAERSTIASSLPANAPKVLIVDDDSVALKVMADLLTHEGLQVTAVMNGLEALRVWEREPDWDLVVLDVMLPGLSGYDLCRIIRERSSFYDLPVLFLTSRNQPADLLVGFDAGANDYVTQPIDASEFRARARTLLRMKRSIRDQLDMEMALIQAQIKPHFLFNTLNTIASLSEIDPERTRELLNDFGNYLRSSFDLRNLDRKVPFSKEWTLVESYLQIEQARFGNRMEVTVTMPEHLSFHLPPLSLQPLVENALRHGILTRFKGGQVHIEIIEDQLGYEIAVRDNGVGFPPGKIEEVLSGANRTGIGLLNVHRRLLNAYGTGLMIDSMAGVGTEIRFRIPSGKEE